MLVRSLAPTGSKRPQIGVAIRRLHSLTLNERYGDFSPAIGGNSERKPISRLPTSLKPSGIQIWIQGRTERSECQLRRNLIDYIATSADPKVSRSACGVRAQTIFIIGDTTSRILRGDPFLAMPTTMVPASLDATGRNRTEELDSRRQPTSGTEDRGDSFGGGKLPQIETPGARLSRVGSTGAR